MNQMNKPGRESSDDDWQAWENACWDAAWEAAFDWIKHLRGMGPADIHVVEVPDTCDLDTIIVSNRTSGDAYVITCDPTADTIDAAVDAKWYPEDVTAQISRLWWDSPRNQQPPTNTP